MIRSICITGGTGTIGRALTKHLLKNSVIEKIMILSRDETKQEEMRKELDDPRLEFHLGCIKDFDALFAAVQGMDAVVHAAALKRVIGGEDSPIAYTMTNVVGTINVVRACQYAGVKKALLLSTDKAVAPVNLYGASKLCGEKIFLAGNGKTLFSVIRYGNVLGSNGSVIRVWEKTRNPCVADAYRFWIQVENAASNIEYVLNRMKGGEIAVCGGVSSSVKRLFQSLYGDKEYAEGQIEPGEKYAECLMDENEPGHYLKDREREIFWIFQDSRFMDRAIAWSDEYGEDPQKIFTMKANENSGDKCGEESFKKLLSL